MGVAGNSGVEDKVAVRPLVITGIISSVCTILVTWLVGLPILAIDSLQRYLAEATLAQLQVVKFSGQQNPSVYGDYTATCAKDTQKLIGGYCGIEISTSGQWKLENAGIREDGKTYECTWMGDGKLSATIYAQCLDHK